MMLRSSSSPLLRLLLAACCLGLLGACAESTGLAIGEERTQANEAAIEAEMIELIRQISLDRRESDPENMVRRFNQPKTIACLEGELIVEPLSTKLSVGLFADPGRYPVTMRFANATQFDDREADLRGLSFKVTGVDNAGPSGVQDFTLNSYPVLFAGTPEDFLSFVQASASDSLLGYFLNPFDSHLKSLWIVLRARGNPSSPLDVSYYSTTPYAYGQGAAVKYSARSCGALAPAATQDDENYLRHALARDLAAGPQCLELLVQFQSDADLMPIEDAAVAWPEDVSPYQPVARVEIPPQDVSAADTLAQCEAMQFNPWNTRPEHRPLGGINRLRKNIYEDLGEFRTQQNAGAR